MPRFIDLTDQTFNRLTVLHRVENNKREARWECRCKCGNITIVTSFRLTSGRTKSCGCLQRELVGNMNKTHGLAGIPEYKIWIGIIQRCTDSNQKSFKNYGGRGITICKKWRNDFMAFYDDIGTKPTPKHTIERIDNNGNYEPSNCKWATCQENTNNKRNNHFITINNWTLTIAQWARFVGIKWETLHKRIKLGWPVEKAIFKRVNH